MTIKNRKELFVQMLSNAWHGTEHTTKFFQELSQLAQDPDIKEALEARVFIAKKITATLDECFRIIGEKPAKAMGRFFETVVEDFRKEFSEIQSPEARHLFILAKMNHLVHAAISSYTVMIAAADMTGHYAVGVLLESVLADKLAFAERNRRLVRNIIEGKVAARAA